MTGLAERSAPIVLSAPSGAGKTTIARRLVGDLDHFTFAVSATTRSPREGEIEGQHYHFVTPEEFDAMIEADELLEWAEVHGERYGTPRSYVETAQAARKHVMLDIDVQGALQVKERTADPILIFILPPSVEVLLERLEHRGTESRKQVLRRLRNARREIAEASRFDYLVINDRIEDAVGAVRAIAEAHQATSPYRIRSMAATSGLIRTFMDGLGRLLDEEIASQDP